MKKNTASKSRSSSGNTQTKRSPEDRPASKKDASSKEDKSKRKWVYKPQVISIEDASDEVKQAVARIRGELLKLKEYKKILSSEGLSPDDYDKIRESELIKQLIRIEKGLPAKSKPKKPRNAKKKKA